jgi:uncharacterized membrane protein YjfL (UPF0719 family)
MLNIFALLLNIPLVDGIVESLVYSVIGIVMAVLAYKIVDWLTPGNLNEKIAKDGNIGLAIVAGSLILGICIIIAQVIGG